MGKKVELTFRTILPAAVVVVVLAGLAWVDLFSSGGFQTSRKHPQGIMGTTCLLKAVAPTDRASIAQEAVDSAEAVLRRAEALMSTYIETSEISQINSARAGVRIELSGPTAEVLELARRLTTETGGAFDPTFAPLFRLWKRCGEAQRLPTREELDEIRSVCGWDNFDLGARTVTKRNDAAMVDLGAIAKGYAIDWAVAAMADAGACAGLVDVGGDIRCFGRHEEGRPWSVGIQDPFHPDRPGASLGKLRCEEGAVCTSGNYRRFVTIDSMRYSHIVDPRTLRPATAAPSVTVVAPTAVRADAWATALSVLGPEGLKLVKPSSGIEAMLIVGSAEDYRKITTPGMAAMIHLRQPHTPKASRENTSP